MGYPDISFAVEDFKDAFKSLVIIFTLHMMGVL